MTGLEFETNSVFEFGGECNGAFRNALDRRQTALVHASALACRARRDLDHAVRLRAHLAGQDFALGQLFRADGFIRAVTRRVFAGFAYGLAGTAHAVTAIEGNIEFGANRGVGNALALFAVDKPSYAVFKIEGDLIDHSALRVLNRTVRLFLVDAL
ncbi:hypothetical protein QF002_008501 [Paraburkholderia youngii]